VDFKDIVRKGIEEYAQELGKALDGLTAEERRFQPTPTSHHIDFAVWHMARVEDYYFNAFGKRVEQLWARGNWHEKLGLPRKDTGYGYSVEKVKDLPRFDLAAFRSYMDGVHKEALAYLDALTQADLVTCPWPEREPGYTVGAILAHIVVHQSRHMGQVEYLRGIQRGFGA